MKNILYEKFKNIPLSKKILIILFFTILVSSLLLYAGYLMIISSNNGQLYQTSSRMLSSASEDISQDLDALEKMGDSILQDETIQNALYQCRNTTDAAALQNAHSSIYTAVNSYYQRYKANHVNYVQIVNEDFTAMASASNSRVIPSEIQRMLISRAEEQDGHLSWVTDFSGSYGIFLVRELKRTENLSLDNLGVLIISVDMNGLHEDISYANSAFPISYALYSEDKNLYLSDNLEGLNQKELSGISPASYDIRDINGQKYLIVKGQIITTGWDYYCLASYNSMYRNIRVIQRLFFVVIIISILVSVWLMKLMMRPLNDDFDKLTQKIQMFGNGDLSVPKTPDSYADRHDEIGLIHQQFDSMAESIRTLIKENYESRLQAKEAQLKALEMQINPHFLYNTLQTINWRAKMLHDSQISTMTESLGKFLRITLSKNNEDSSLGQELELVQYYINIQELRFDEDLSYETDIPEDCMRAYLPKFTLQPLVENAIRYGLEEGEDGCHIRVTASVSDGKLTIRVANTGSSFEDHFLEKLMSKEILPHGFGIGVLNVNSRLELAYGSDYSIEFTNVDDQAIVNITIPFRTGKPEPPSGISNRTGELKC